MSDRGFGKRASVPFSIMIFLAGFSAVTLTAARGDRSNAPYFQSETAVSSDSAAKDGQHAVAKIGDDYIWIDPNKSGGKDVMIKFSPESPLASREGDFTSRAGQETLQSNAEQSGKHFCEIVHCREI